MHEHVQFMRIQPIDLDVGENEHLGLGRTDEFESENMTNGAISSVATDDVRTADRVASCAPGDIDGNTVVILLQTEQPAIALHFDAVLCEMIEQHLFRLILWQVENEPVWRFELAKLD